MAIYFISRSIGDHRLNITLDGLNQGIEVRKEGLCPDEAIYREAQLRPIEFLPFKIMNKESFNSLLIVVVDWIPPDRHCTEILAPL